MTKHIDSQFGFTAASSTLHAEVVIRDTLRYYNNNDTPIYMCSLDAEKAFGCCNWFTLFSKLAEKDIPTFIITFLIKLYRNGSAHVNYISSRSATFSLTQGVRQGGILSPYLYNLYTEDLITNIKSMNIGTFLTNKTHTAIIVYADDIILLSPSSKHLQSMVAKCEDYGHTHGLKFNQSKHNSLFLEHQGSTDQQSLSATAASFLNKIVCRISASIGTTIIVVTYSVYITTRKGRFQTFGLPLHH